MILTSLMFECFRSCYYSYASMFLFCDVGCSFCARFRLGYRPSLRLLVLPPFGISPTHLRDSLLRLLKRRRDNNFTTSDSVPISLCFVLCATNVGGSMFGLFGVRFFLFTCGSGLTVDGDDE